MFEAPESDYLVPFDQSFRISKSPTSPPGGKKLQNAKRLRKAIKKIDRLQRALYAADRHAVLLVFQGMDAGGKDSTIRAVMQGINPAGCQVFSFKKPSVNELEHDFLWRTTRALPERGRIGIFNRSHYEEVLVVRVHPEILDSQKLPNNVDPDTIWDERFESIRDFEKHIARNGTVVIKFWLNVSREEQRKRFLDRLNDDDKQWKFKPQDIKERGYWNDYMQAYEAALNATSRPWAPWYAIPANSKPYMRACVAEIIAEAMGSIGLEYPQASAEDRALFDESRRALSRRVES
jgi:PPK2 family polyphosphate:nucleotide phosphotransferase